MIRVAAALAATLAFAALPVVALGHASLIASDPADGATITTPHTLKATFDEELTPDGSTLLVENGAGTQVATGTVTADDDKTMSSELPLLPGGTYTVRWTAVTADDLAVERGTFTFNVGSANSTAVPMVVDVVGSGGDPVIALAVGGLFIAAVFLFIIIRRSRR